MIVKVLIVFVAKGDIFAPDVGYFVFTQTCPFRVPTDIPDNL